MDRRSFEIQRAFDHLEHFLSEEEHKCKACAHSCEYAEGDLMVEMDTSPPPCDKHCTYKQLRPSHIDPDVFVFVCKKHHRVHRCGVDCIFKELSHEAYSCPRSGMVIPLSLIDDDQANGGVRRTAAEGKKNVSGADEVSDKFRVKHEKNAEAIKEALVLCSDSFATAGIDTEEFSRACERYLNFLKKSAKDLSKNICTKRSVSHFALAMAFMHRTGYVTKGVTLFKRYAQLGTAMPKSHGLNKKKYKMRAITRIQDALRSHIRHLNHVHKIDLEAYKFPLSAD